MVIMRKNDFGIIIIMGIRGEYYTGQIKQDPKKIHEHE